MWWMRLSRIPITSSADRFNKRSQRNVFHFSIPTYHAPIFFFNFSVKPEANVFLTKITHLSCGVLGCASFSWLLQPKYGVLYEFLIDDPTDMKLEFAGTPRVKVFLPEVLGDIWFEFKCEVDQRPKPCDPPPFAGWVVGVWLECAVCPWWLCADGLNKIKFLSDFCEPNELSDVVFEFKPVQRADSCVRFLLKLPGL